MLLPRMLSESRVTGFFPFKVILTVFRWVFMLMSTPTGWGRTAEKAGAFNGWAAGDKPGHRPAAPRARLP
eukprot:SAG22_NODE_7176_length_767_cov_0.962575_2_plen_69_part_01